jgi:myosin-crossreactive antigen
MEIDAAQRELAEINRRMAEMRSNLIRDETMFSESKTFIERKQSEIQDLNRECENLTHKNFHTNIKAQQAKELSDDLNLIRSERD